jgi:AAHS family 4-hydroxybenzoate transporter-like MFS transporter
MGEPATASTAESVDVAQLIDEQRFGPFQFWVLLLCASAMFVDGFDTQAISYVAPSLSAALAVKPAALGTVFAAGGFGTLLGTLAFAPFADRIGRKPMIIGCLLAFAACSLLTSMTNTVFELRWMRFATGLGLGGVVPNALALTAEYMPKRLRVTLVMIAWFGFSTGSGFAGPIAAHILGGHTWRTVFLFGGLLPMLLSPLLLWGLPESLQCLAQRGADRRRISATLARMNPRLLFPESVRFINSEKKEKGFPVTLLFREGRARVTLLLWVMFFMNLLALFFLNSWLPTALHATGISVHTSIIIASLMHFGGIVGGLAIAPLCDKFNPYIILATAYVLSGVSIAGIGMAGNVAVLAIATTSLAGFFTFGAQNCANAIAATIYPTAMRSSGVGWALGIGRSGQIVGPLIGGLLFSMHWGTSGVLDVVALPSVVAATAALFLLGSTPRFEASREALAK